MRERFHILHQTVLLLIMAAVLLTACSSDSPEAQVNRAGEASVAHVVHLATLASSYVEPASDHRAAPVGYSAYPLDKVIEMGIYVFLPPENYETPVVPELQRIKYDGAKWHAYFSVDPNKTYYIRFKNVLDADNKQFYMDYIEYCAKEVYDNPVEPEDIW